MGELSKKKGFIFDLDGVVYIGDTPIEGAGETLACLREKRKKVRFLTNNASKSRRDYARKLNEMRIECDEEEVITSSYGAAIYLKEKYKKGKCVVIGEEGLKSELAEQGFEVVSGREGEDANFVVVGIDRNFNYVKLTTALRAVKSGARFIATNLNPSKPSEGGILPGAGAMVAALEVCSGAKPEVIIGKPNPMLFDICIRSMQIRKEEVATVGDVVDVDIVGSNRLHLYSILVLTGIAKKEDLKNLNGEMKPNLILNSIAELRELI